MKRACPVKLNNCPGADSPITNASSEAPDPLLFAGIGWDQFDPYRPPNLGDGPGTDDQDCSNITWTATSQELADLLAFLNAQFCVDPRSPDVPGVPPLPPPFEGDVSDPIFFTPTQPSFEGLPLMEFTNDRQFASVDCPDGSVFTAEIPAGTVVSPPMPQAVGEAWVAYINAYLLAYLLQNLLTQRVCIVVPGIEDRTEPGVPPPAPPPSGGAPVTLASRPGWACLGESLIPSQNTYNVSGGSGSFVFSLTAGALAPGTSLIQTGPRSAVVTGTPTVAGTYSYTITATSGSASISASDTLNVFGLVSDVLPDAMVNTPYSEQLEAAGGSAPFTFSLTAGVLPDGLSMDAAGLISGIPSADGVFDFEVTVEDAAGGSCSFDVSIETLPVPVCTSVDWASTLWGVPSENVFGPGGGSATFYSPVSAAGINIHCDCTSVGGPDTYSTAAANIGSLTIKTDAITSCTLHMDVTSANNVFTGIHQAVVNIWLDAPFVGTLVASHDVGSLGNGSYDFGFTLPNTGCVNRSVFIQASTVIFGPVLAANSSIDLVATITTP